MTHRTKAAPLASAPARLEVQVPPSPPLLSPAPGHGPLLLERGHPALLTCRAHGRWGRAQPQPVPRPQPELRWSGVEGEVKGKNSTSR
jgi:hypothetical protein